MSFANKVAVVTGGGGGIGRATGLGLACRGVSVAVLDINGESAQQVARAIERAGGVAMALPCDITVSAQVDGAVAGVLDRFGRVDILVNNAGAGGGGFLHETSPELIERLIATNLTGHMFVSRAVLMHMVPRKSGTIVNVASEAGTSGVARAAAYGAAKGGVIALTKSLARELAPHRILVNCVCPGPTLTPMFEGFIQRDPARAQAYIDRIPLARPAKPEDIAAAIVFLASSDARYMTGTVLSVDGGLSMAP